MPRTVPSTSWSRQRFIFSVADVNGVFLQDVNSIQITGQSNDQQLTTSWT